MEETTYLVVDGENIDATLGLSVLDRRPNPEERPRWDRVLEGAHNQWGQRAKGLFFLNGSSGYLPMGFVQALTAMDYAVIPLSGPEDMKVVDVGLQRTMDAIVKLERGSVILASHDADFVPQIEALLDAGRALAEVTGGQGVSYGYTGDGAQVCRMFWGLYAQTGATCTLTPGQPVQMDREAAIRVTRLVKDMLDGEIAAPDLDYGGAIASFSTGRTGITFMGNWELQSFLKAGIPFDAMPMPAVFGTPASFGDCHVFVLPRQADLDEDRRDAAYEVVAGMLSSSLDWADGGHTPADLRITESAAYRALEPQSHYADVMNQAVFEPAAWFTGSGSDFQSRVSEVMQACWLSGSITPEQAVDGLIDRLDHALAQNPPA